MITTLFVWMLGYFVFVAVGVGRSHPYEEIGVDVVSLVRNNYGTIDSVAFATFALGFALAYRHFARAVRRS